MMTPRASGAVAAIQMPPGVGVLKRTSGASSHSTASKLPVAIPSMNA